MNLHDFLKRMDGRNGQVHVEAELTLTLNRCRFELVGDGQQLMLHPESRSALRELIRYGGSSLTDHLHQLLDSLQLTLDVCLNGRTLGRVGNGAQPGFTSMLFGFGPVQLCTGNLLVETFNALNPFS